MLLQVLHKMWLKLPYALRHRGSQNRPHEKECLVLGTNLLLLQLLHMLWLKSPYTPVYYLKPRPILHWPCTLKLQ